MRYLGWNYVDRTNLPEWKSYDRETGNIMILEEKAVLKPGMLKQEFDFLEMGQ